MEANFQDFLGWCTDKDILKSIGDEILYFSNKVFKYNSFNMKQERNLILTNKCLYNLQNKKVKRQMKYEEMLGITFSNQSNEFVVHADKGYDFHFVSPEKMIIIYIIAKCYEKLLNKPIILCEVKDKSLKQYVTTKKDKKKNSNNSKLNENNSIDTQTFIIDNDPVEINKRSFTEVSGGKVSNLTVIQENPKNINSVIIFSNDEKIKYISYDDFVIFKIIGRGTTGKVFLAKNKFNDQYYALKSVDLKYFDIDDGSFRVIKKFSKNFNFPFIINVHFCFETEERLYLAFPYIQGEELFYHLNANQNFNEQKIKFYAGIISITLDYLHKNGIEYKFFNLKNILIDKDGYLKLVPFHIGKLLKLKKSNHKSNNIREKYINEYSPPEIYAEGDSHITKFADWWNLGVIIYEMIYGIPPFFSDIDTELKNRVTKNELNFPKIKNISDNLKDLTKQLLNKNFEERLGYKNGFEDIKNHEFFKGFNFDELLERKMQSPYKPVIGDIPENNKKIEEKFTYEDLQKSGIILSN
jgi:serum/glucocorticoid-regulated kinase 2